MKYSYKKNRLLQLRGFCTVIEEGSILKASQKMNTAQSNVSLQISSLERDLKIQLFKRENQRLIPTTEALRFYKICKKSVDDIDFMFENSIGLIKKDYDNIIKLAGHSYMLSHILPPYFRKLLKVTPQIRFEICNLSYEDSIDRLNNKIIDMAFYPASPIKNLKNMAVKEFYKCEFTLAMSKEHPLALVKDKDITWNMISNYDYISLGKGITAQGLKSTIDVNGINSRFELENGNWEICMGMIKEGLAISGADIQYFKWHNDVVVKKCSHLMPDYQFNLLLNKEEKLSPASSSFLEVLNINV